MRKFFFYFKFSATNTRIWAQLRALMNIKTIALTELEGNASAGLANLVDQLEE